MFPKSGKNTAQYYNFWCKIVLVNMGFPLGAELDAWRGSVGHVWEGSWEGEGIAERGAVEPGLR